MRNQQVIAVAAGREHAEISRLEAKLLLAPFADGAFAAAHPRMHEPAIADFNALGIGTQRYDFADEVLHAQIGRRWLVADGLKPAALSARYVELFELWEKDMEGLIASITAVGLIEPITVTCEEGSESYRIITGHRRFRAAKAAGLTQVKSPVRSWVYSMSVAF